MAAITEKRIQSRYVLDDSFTIHHKGSPCRVVDISETGLGISYIGGEDWPEKIVLEYSLARESGRKRFIKCRTVWESSMVFYKTRGEAVVRRRGLKFLESGSGDVGDLDRHLKSKADMNP